MYFEAQNLSRRFFLPCQQRCSVKSSDPDRTKIYYGNATTGRKCAFGAKISESSLQLFKYRSGPERVIIRNYLKNFIYFMTYEHETVL